MFNRKKSNEELLHRQRVIAVLIFIATVFLANIFVQLYELQYFAGGLALCMVLQKEPIKMDEETDDEES